MQISYVTYITNLWTLVGTIRTIRCNIAQKCRRYTLFRFGTQPIVIRTLQLLDFANNANDFVRATIVNTPALEIAFTQRGFITLALHLIHVEDSIGICGWVIGTSTHLHGPHLKTQFTTHNIGILETKFIVTHITPFSQDLQRSSKFEKANQNSNIILRYLLFTSTRPLLELSPPVKRTS